MQLRDSDGHTWSVTATAFDMRRGRGVFEFRDERGIPRTASLSMLTLCSGARARRWLRFHAGIDVEFSREQHVGDLGRLARELNR